MTLPSRSGHRIASAIAAAAIAAAPLAPAVAQGAGGDPPARVGRLAGITGTVSYHLAGADRWEPAVLNLPVSSGAAFWTEPAARAEVGLAGNRIVMDQSTEFEVGQLDDRSLMATEAQGSVYLHLRDVPLGQRYTVQTPRGSVAIATVGRYEVVAGDTAHPTTVTVIEGAAQVAGPGLALQVGPNQTATIVGDGRAAPFQASLGPAVRSPFLAALLASERPAPRRALPQAALRMTGAEDLDQYGDWSATAEYGEVWYPRADPGFVPYRNGHWAYVQPWGWTWVDDAPWGFAPSHYGRWVEAGGRWGWVPALPSAPPSPYPVYAPAVVSFVAGAALGAAVGWVPLGPREPYIPPYRASPAYVRQVNVTTVQNVNIINSFNRPGPRPGLMNAAAGTLVPQSAMAGSQRVGPLAQPLAAAQAGPVFGRVPVAPTAATTGVTPALARRLNLAAAPPQAQPAAPGPAFNPQAVPGRHPVSLRPAAGAPPAAPTQAAPAGIEQPPPGMLRPGAGAPGGAGTGPVGAPLLRQGQPGTGPAQPPAPGPAPAALPSLRPAGPPGPSGSQAGAPGPAIQPRPAAPGTASGPAALQSGEPGTPPRGAPPGLLPPDPAARGRAGPGGAEPPAGPHRATPPQVLAPNPAAPPRPGTLPPGAIAPALPGGGPRPGQATAPVVSTPPAPRAAAPASPPASLQGGPGLTPGHVPEARHPVQPSMPPPPRPAAPVMAPPHHVSPPPMPQRPMAPPPQTAQPAPRPQPPPQQHQQPPEHRRGPHEPGRP